VQILIWGDLVSVSNTEVKEQFLLKISLTGLQHWKTRIIMWASIGLLKILENIRISAKESLGHHELKQRKPWFDKEC
jgi:hypothetical protein